MVTHPSTNLAQCTATLLIETNALPLTPPPYLFGAQWQYTCHILPHVACMPESQWHIFCHIFEKLQQTQTELDHSVTYYT